MESIKAWGGAGGRLHTSAWDAAADIIKSASEFDIKCVTDDPPRNSAVKATILWMADEIRKSDAKLKRERRGKR